MPSRPSWPIAGARSRVGSVPCSYHSSTCGSTRSAAKRRTVSAMSRSSSESRPSRSSGSSGRTLGRVAVADMPPSVVGLLLPWREHGGDPGVADADRRSGGYRRRQRGQIEHKPSPGRTVESVRADMAVDTTVQVTLPQMGESVTEGTVLEWHKQEGDRVEADEVLVEVSTDKVDAEVPAPASGTVAKIHAAEGDTVEVGAVLAEIATGNGNGAAAAGGNGGGTSAPAREESDGASGNGAPAPAADAEAEAEPASEAAPGETLDI